MLIPLGDWVLVENIIEESVVMTPHDIEDSHQKGKVIEVGEGFWHNGTLIRPTVKPGDTVFWERLADSNTPPQIKRLNDNYELILGARLMAVETE